MLESFSPIDIRKEIELVFIMSPYSCSFSNSEVESHGGKSGNCSSDISYLFG